MLNRNHVSFLQATRTATTAQWILWLLLICSIAALIFSYRKKPTLLSRVFRSEPTEVRHVKTVPFGRFSSVFNDLNDKHLEAANCLGIQPITSREEAQSRRWRLKELASNGAYKLDPLTHSIPFLVPQADRLLRTIGERFNALQEERGAGGYRLIVTSVLRVDEDIHKLRRGNVNASSNSAHRYGTTFDIAYNRFDGFDNRYKVPEGELKHLLGEVLLELKKEGACYVKYEIKQGCFHITAR